jgi:hypothetical protein
MPLPFQDALLQNFQNNAPASPNAIVGRGSLITFDYMFYKHDPKPLVLITDYPYFDPRNGPRMREIVYVRGLNFHYLTFPAIKNLMFLEMSQNKTMCENQQFSYQNYLKGTVKPIMPRSAFRQYKVQGVRSIKKLNCEFIVKALEISRSFDPNQIEAIRKEVREQIRRMANPQAAPTGEMPMNQNINPPNQ